MMSHEVVWDPAHSKREHRDYQRHRVTPVKPTLTSRHSVLSATEKNTSSDTGNLSYSDDPPSDDDCYMSDAVAQKLVLRTELRVSQNMAKSRFVRDHCRLYNLPRFSQDDLEIGPLIAKGGFSNVHSIASFRGDSELSFQRPTSPTSFYVVKHLNPRLALSNSKKLLSGARDLFWEAHLLASFNHRHILKLRGWSLEGVGGFMSTGRADGFFLIFDRLEGTLFQRLSQWRRRAREDDVLNSIHKRKKYPNTMKLLQQRLKVARDITDAFSYLHDVCNVFHLDLKPGNVGFDQDGVLKLFDFGLATEVIPQGSNPDQVFDLNGKKGTSRYMAPEVISRKHYNCKADVYSFCILLWEMLSLSKPYGGMDGNEVKENVAHKGLRPKIIKEWPSQIRMILKYGFSKRPEERPTMAQIQQTLEKILVALATEEATLSSSSLSSSARHSSGSSSHNKLFHYSTSK